VRADNARLIVQVIHKSARPLHVARIFRRRMRNDALMRPTIIRVPMLIVDAEPSAGAIAPSIMESFNICCTDCTYIVP